jgi:hypothetical protein
MAPHGKMIAANRAVPTVVLLLLAMSSAACNNLPTTPVTPTDTAIPRIATLPARNATPTPTQTQIPLPSPIPAKNGWVPEFTPTMTVASADQYSEEQIARILFTQWLDHFKTDDADSQNRLDEYQVSEVRTPENLAFLADEKKLDSVATVVFSVRPSIYLYSNWNAGNGMSTDNTWIEDKYLIIGVDKANGMYSLVIIGTGP